MVLINNIRLSHAQNAFETASTTIEDEVEERAENNEQKAKKSCTRDSKKVVESIVDFVNVGMENEYLALRILVFETWIGFELPIKNILVKEVDVLRAQVVDAQEEIATLKSKQGVQFISVRANGNAEGRQIIAWPVVVHNSGDAFFALDKTNQNIIVKLPGVYQIHVRIGVANSLSLNGSAIARELLSDANGYHTLRIN